MVTSCTQLEMELQKPPIEKGRSIQELVSKHMNEGKNMVEMSFKGQHESLPSLLKVIEEEDSSYNEVVTSRSKEELKKLTRGDDDVQCSSYKCIFYTHLIPMFLYVFVLFL